MATIAKAMITLTNVNDAYSVVLSPDSCVIKADFDGSNPNLDAAFTDITVVRGETKHAYKLEVAAISNSTITYQLGSIDAYTKRIKLTNIPSDTLSGYLSFTVSTDDDYVATVTFQYSVVRETSMLDWILDWENNKTKIGDSYLITPKLFVGKKVENEDGLKKLTGVYIGPDTVNTAGIYGYKEGKDVFHINAFGAMIGGWEINKEGISTSNKHGYIKLLSDGNISFKNIEDDTIWGLWDDGSAIFAKGNVTFSADGSASFSGNIVANSGEIAGWTICDYALYNEYVRLDSASRLIGVCGHQSSATQYGSDFISDVWQYGGVYMNYVASGNYGLRGYLPGIKKNDTLTSKQTFALGSENKIANWYFDNDSLYMGDKVNMTRKYTNASSDITIGSQGLRGSSWYIDNDGSISFAKGMIKLDENGGTIVGWKLQTNRFGSTHAALVSDTSLAGLYLSKSADLKGVASSNLQSTIKTNGGIYLCTDGATAQFYASDKDAKQTFYITTNGINKIANWYFDKDAIYTGTKATSGFASSGSITIGTGGIRGYRWRLESDGSASFCNGLATFNSDGSGSLAGGNISWDKSGTITFTNSVVLAWSKPYIDDADKSAKAAADAAASASSSASSASSAANSASSSASSAADSASSASSAADSSAASKKAAERAAAIAAAVGEDVDTKYANLIGSKLTYIDSTGIYTGTLVADQISGLACTFVKGSIGGWSISSDHIAKNGVYLGSDGSIYNYSHWSLNSDGSGSLAGGNISWDKSGNLSAKGEINATSGKIGNWYIKNGVIASDDTGSESTYIKLDASNKLIRLQTSSNSYNDGSYDYNMNGSFGAILSLDSSHGTIRVEAKNAPSYSTATSYLSSNGIFSNIAAINGLPSSSGYTHRGAIVGLGYANVNKSAWAMNEDETIVAGVYGRANNSGTAAAYGGFFYQLKACGLSTSVFYFTEKNAGAQISLNDTTVIGLINKGYTSTIYLPQNAHEGQEVEIIQMGQGVTRIDTNDGTHIYDDISENEYYDCPEGWVTICKKVKYSINNTTYDIWAVHQYHFK